MSINSCTIDCNTIDAICVDRRQAIIDGLMAFTSVITTLAFPTNVAPHLTVVGTVTFTATGPAIANGVAFTLTLTPHLATTPILTGLPVGATYSYNAVNGDVMFFGMPTSMNAGDVVGPITVSYEQPVSGVSTVHATITTTTSNPDPSAGSAHATINSATKAHQQHVHPDTKINLNIFRREHEHTDELEEALELPYIAVTIEMAGEVFTQTLERTDENFVPMINVYGISLKPIEIEESVNISDIMIRIL